MIFVPWWPFCDDVDIMVEISAWFWFNCDHSVMTLVSWFSFQCHSSSSSSSFRYYLGVIVINFFWFRYEYHHFGIILILLSYLCMILVSLSLLKYDSLVFVILSVWFWSCRHHFVIIWRAIKSVCANPYHARWNMRGRAHMYTHALTHINNSAPPFLVRSCIDRTRERCLPRLKERTVCIWMCCASGSTQRKQRSVSLTHKNTYAHAQIRALFYLFLTPKQTYTIAHSSLFASCGRNAMRFAPGGESTAIINGLLWVSQETSHVYCVWQSDWHWCTAFDNQADTSVLHLTIKLE